MTSNHQQAEVSSRGQISIVQYPSILLFRSTMFKTGNTPVAVDIYNICRGPTQSKSLLSLSLSIGIYIYYIYIYHIYQYSFTLYDYSQADLDSYSDHFVPSYVHTLWSSYSVLEQLLHKPLIWCRGAHVPRHLLSKTSHSMPWSHTSPSSFNIILYIIFALYFNMLRYASTNHEHMCIVIVTFVVLVAHIILSYTTHYHTI